jgi:C4-dicarboxylate-specific signal transduction histidine kinase
VLPIRLKRACFAATQRSLGCHVASAESKSGPGVEPKNIERLFEPFYTTKPDGMGMGLSICRSIVEEHGGRLSATPGRPCGLAMQISLPAILRVGALENIASAAFS